MRDILGNLFVLIYISLFMGFAATVRSINEGILCFGVLTLVSIVYLLIM